MSYDMKLQVDWEETLPTYTEFAEELHRISDYFGSQEEVMELEYGNKVRWEHHNDDMVQTSTKWPEVVFRLTGHGENDEKWVTYYRGGNYYTDYVDIPPFDEAKMAPEESPGTNTELQEIPCNHCGRPSVAIAVGGQLRGWETMPVCQYWVISAAAEQTYLSPEQTTQYIRTMKSS